MSAAWLKPKVAFDAATGVAAVECEVRNESTEEWRAAEGFAIGSHLFDARTGTLLIDGARCVLDRDIEPGAAASVRLEVEIPAEDGDYQVVVSAMREGVCWYYESGWPILLIEARREDGRAELAAPRTATFADLQRRRALRSLVRGLYYPWVSIWTNRSLIRTMVRRDIAGRYRGSFGGVAWTFLNPLLLMATYFFVFGVVLQSRFGGDTSRSGFALYFLAGMLPWLAFQEAAGRAASVMLEHRNFVRKLVFAVETLPVNLVVSGLVNQFFAILLFCVFLLVVRGTVPWTIVFLPVLLVPQILFTAGVSWFLAALGVFVRDLGQVIGFILTLWFFLTPICYPESQLPPSAMLILSKNPIFVLVRGYRAIFLEAQPPDFGSLWKLWVLSMVVFLAGHAWFYKLRKSFADIV